MINNRNSSPRIVGAIAAILLLLCFVGIASAATVTYSGTNPTKNTDGTDIPATGAGSLTQLRIEYGTCVGTAFGTKAGEVTRTSPAAGANFTGSLNLQPGTSCLRIFVQNTYGAESDPSNVVTRVVDPPKPMPPTLAAVPLAGLDIPLDSLDGFKRTVAYTVTSNGPGVLAAFCKVATPAASDPLFTYRGQTYCKPLANHPTTGAANCAYIKGVVATEIATPCA